MKTIKLLLLFLLVGISFQVKANEKERIPKDEKWERTNDREFDDYMFFSGMTDDSGEFFHMNMGSGSNMWCYQDDAIYGGDNYSLDRKMYHVIPEASN